MIIESFLYKCILEKEGEKMYQNAGTTVKNLGKILFIIGLIVSVFYGITTWVSGAIIGRTTGDNFLFGVLVFFLGVVVIVAGSFVSYLANAFIVAFGELVESNMAMKALLEQMISKDKTNANGSMSEPLTKRQSTESIQNVSRDTDYKKCPICGAKNDWNVFTCTQCGFGLSGTVEKVKPTIGDIDNNKKEGYWYCTKCGTENCSGIYCTKCGNRKSV